MSTVMSSTAKFLVLLSDNLRDMDSGLCWTDAAAAAAVGTPVPAEGGPGTPTTGTSEPLS